MDKREIQEILEKKPELRDKLFARGFLFTNATVEADSYPFYGIWKEEYIGNYSLFVSPKQTYYNVTSEKGSFILIGHAYNPFSMTAMEDVILKNLMKIYSPSDILNPSSPFWKKVNELTGVFTIIIIDGNSMYIIGDASGMQTTFYTVNTNNLYISSHTNLIGDLLNLQWDPYIKRLKAYRFFRLLGNSLPGDLTQFKELKRLIPNHYVRFESGYYVEEKRFYCPHRLNMSEKEISEKVASLLHSNMRLISEKWEKPAISLTGGCDSKTTLACTNGLYDKFSYFSYISSESEEVDAIAAKKICDALGLKHTTYMIPDKNEDVANYNEVSEILNWNTGNILYSHPNDIRKRIYFADTKHFDVEVKSWASEIGRAYYSKRFYGRKDFGNRPSGRKCTTLYKFFFHDRKLVKETDLVFKDYLNRHYLRSRKNPVEWQEQFFWEFRVPSWNGLVITGEHRFSFDITIPYNNRRILELLMSASIDDRITDRIYKNIRLSMNPEVDYIGISVTNLKHSRKRELAEALYYFMHCNTVL